MQLIYKQGYICHQSVTTCTGQPTQTRTLWKDTWHQCEPVYLPTRMIKHWISDSKNSMWEVVDKALRNISEIECHCWRDCRQVWFLDQRREVVCTKFQTSDSSSTARALKQMVISLEQRRIVNYFVTMMGRITEIIEQEVKLEKLLQSFTATVTLWIQRYFIYWSHILLSASSVSEVMKSLVPYYIDYMNTGLLEACNYWEVWM